MSPFHDEVSDAGFEEAKRRYNMPEAESLDEISEAQIEKRRLQWARELGLPDDAPLETIKEEMRQRMKKNREQRAA